MKNSHANVDSGLTSQEIQAIIGQKYKFEKAQREGSSPSQTYILEDGYKFGIIEHIWMIFVAIVIVYVLLPKVF